MSENFDIFAYLMGKQAGGGGGGDITVVSKSISSNGTFTAPTGKAYSPVIVDVPNTYTAGDEGKVVSNGELVSQTAHAEVTQNGTIDTTLNNSVTVNVSGVNYVKSTIEFTAGNKSVTLDREFENFLLWAFADPAPAATPSNNSVIALMFAYIDGDFWMPSKTTNVKYSSSSFSSGVLSPSGLNVDTTSIKLSAYSASYNYVGSWTVIQMEVPASWGVYNINTLQSILNGGS